MPEREGFPAGVPSWIDSPQPDPDAAAAFYGSLFGWQFEHRTPAGADESYLVAKLDGKEVAGIRPADAGFPAPVAWETYIGVDDADGSAALVRDAGGTVLIDPFDVGDLGRAAACADPEGARFRLWQPGRLKGAETVNAPGAWNFSELHTHDADAAARFYRAVLGWEVSEVDMGTGPATMVRLPGYADFLERFNPGIRQRHADFGAPPGFTECVAWMLPLDSGEAPHWSVTFAVADPDAIAASARELGGTVLAEPADLGPAVRGAVIADPGGARFAANAFKPG
jgi:uncharacterized protein